MKKAFLFISALLLFVSTATVAQENSPGFFVGKWSVTVIGTPNGDAKFGLKVEKSDTTLTAFIIGEGETLQKVDRVETTANSITVYWFAQGYDVYLTLTKKDDGKVEGNLMSMFTANVERIVE